MAVENLWTGNLATPRRAILGVFGLLERNEIAAADAARFLLECGLPPIAVQEPDIPITREQQLVYMARPLKHMDPELLIPHHATEVGFDVHITLFGMLGLTLTYADSLRECLRVRENTLGSIFSHYNIPEL